MGGRGFNCQNNALDYPFERSTEALNSSSKLLILFGKKHAFKFSMYIFEYQPPPPPPSPPYVYLASTHVINAPRPSLFFTAMCIIVSANGR